MIDLNSARVLIRELYEIRKLKREVLDNEDNIKRQLDIMLGADTVLNVVDFILIKNTKSRDNINKNKVIELIGYDKIDQVTEKITYSTLEIKKIA